MHQEANLLKDDKLTKANLINDTKIRNMCYRSKTLAPISRPISNNFALINSNLNEIENLLKNPKADQEINLDLKKGLHDWSLWRSKFNETLVKSCFTPLKLKKSIQTHNDLRIKSQSFIEPSFVHYSSHYGDDTNLDPESFMFYGIPRARVFKKTTLAEELSGRLASEEKLEFETEKKTRKKVVRVICKNQIDDSKVKSKLDHPKNSIILNTSIPDSDKFIETNHVFRQEPEKQIKMMAMPTRENKEVLKAADGDIIFHRANQRVHKSDESPEKINCLGKIRQKADKEKKKNYFDPIKNILCSRTRKSNDFELNRSRDKSKSHRKRENNTLRRRKREHKRKSSLRLSKRKKPDIGKSKNARRNQRSTRAKKRKNRNLNYHIFNPGDYQAYSTRKSPFFITNNTAQNIEYFSNNILESFYDLSQFDKDIIDLSSSSSSTVNSDFTNSKFKSKIRDRTKRHFDRLKKEISLVNINKHSEKNLKQNSRINSKNSASIPIAAPPPPEIETIPKRKPSQMSKSSIPLTQPPPPQVPPPSLSRFTDFKLDKITIESSRENESKRFGLRHMKVTEEKLEFEQVEIIKQEINQPEKKSTDKEKYPNLFKLPKLRYNPQMDTSILSTTTISNRTRPKTSREILQEISRLTNGTSINTKANLTFQNNSSDFDTSIMSSNSKLIQK